MQKVFDDIEKERIFKSQGYSQKMSIGDDELQKLRELIEAQFFSVIEEEYPEKLDSFSRNGLALYHELSYEIDHSATWPKKTRCLLQPACETIKKLPFWKQLENDFGPFLLGRVVYEKDIEWDRDEMYWRIVRPNEPTDVGTLHADKWFHDTMKIRERVFPQGAHALKVWIPIYCEPGKNGLAIVPNSHKDPSKWQYKSVEIENTSKPRLLCDESLVETELLNTPAGNIVIFNQDLVHVGALNSASTTRISLEITMIV
ncbi:phytanoyl-CoA dioxygenase family protein [Halobacteriovorax sp. HLS]|uniref:phytanoyl-CoA dioxygenase family protein n=1 Tax=Halobacteriovorax sp. HLS TaxID=2234000 RepID=UPI000FDA1023|nr:phytanoyl-CoA dioxygenase family protein [Halobacteriovorax sp. HLS]